MENGELDPENPMTARVVMLIYWRILNIWLVVWNMTFIFPYIGNVIIPIDSYVSEG